MEFNVLLNILTKVFICFPLFVQMTRSLENLRHPSSTPTGLNYTLWVYRL